MANTWGGFSSYITVNELTEIVRHAAQSQMGFAQVAEAPTGKHLGKGKGDTVQWTFFPNLSTTGGQLDENEPIPSGSLTPVSANASLAEYGNSIDWTGKLEDLARLTVEDSFTKALVDDLRKVENTAAYTVALLTHWKASFASGGDAFVTNNTCATTMNEHLTLANLGYLRKTAEKYNIPKFDGESYLVITGVEGADQLESDSALTNMLIHDSGRAALNGEIGRVKQCRILKDNHKITQKNTSYDEAFLFGADSIVNEIALPWEIRREVGDFGRQVKLAYYSIQAWFKPLNQTSHSQEHIIHVTSQ